MSLRTTGILIAAALATPAVAQVAPPPQKQPEQAPADDVRPPPDTSVRAASARMRAEATRRSQPADPAPAGPIDPALLRALIEDMDADDLTTRELATARLRDEPGVSLLIIENLAQDRSVAPESRRRLAMVARGLFTFHPKAGLGVQFANNASNDGIRIERTVDPERFPAASVLRADDVIVQLHSVPIRTSEQARAMILSHDPRDIMPAVIRRDGELVRIGLPLGAYDDLNQGGALSTDILDSAWRERRRRWITPDDQPAIGDGVAREAWQAAGARTLRVPPVVTPLPGIAAGGVSTSPGTAHVGQPLEFIGAIAGRPGAGFESMTPEQRARQHRRILDDLDRVESMRAALSQQLQNRSIDDRDQQAARDRYRSLIDRERSLEAELEHLLELGGFEIPDRDP